MNIPGLASALRRRAAQVRRWADELEQLADEAEAADPDEEDEIDEVTEAAIERLIAESGYQFEDEAG